MTNQTPGGRGPSSRFGNAQHLSSESLDARVAAVCADIRNRGRLNRALPIDPPSQRRVDHLVGDESLRFAVAVRS